MQARVFAAAVALCTAVVLSVVLHAASAQVPAGVVSWWAAEDDARDSADGNHGVGQGTVTYPNGRVGSAFGLNGSSWIRVPNARNLAVSRADFTVAGWVKLRKLCADTCDQDIVSKMSPGTVPNTDGWRLLKQVDNHFWFCFGGSPSGTNGCHPGLPTTVISTFRAIPGIWTHVVGVKDGTTISIFVNGVLNRSTTMTAFRDTNRAPLNIGAYSGVRGRESGQLDGRIDEVQIYNRALTAAEIRHLVQPRRDVVFNVLATKERNASKKDLRLLDARLAGAGRILDLDGDTRVKGVFALRLVWAPDPPFQRKATELTLVPVNPVDPGRWTYNKKQRAVVGAVKVVKSNDPKCEEGSVWRFGLRQGASDRAAIDLRGCDGLPSLLWTEPTSDVLVTVNEKQVK